MQVESMVLSKSMQAKITSQTNFEGIQSKEQNRSKHTFELDKLGIIGISVIQRGVIKELTMTWDNQSGNTP